MNTICRQFSTLACLLVVAMTTARTNAQQQPQDTVSKEEAKRIERLAETGNVKAMFNMGVYYEHGQGGLPINNAQAMKWYEKAGQKGDLGAQYNLALMYANGRGTQKDPKQAIYWFKQAAEKGDSGAQYNLGVMYDQGFAGDRGRLESTHWFKEAAERGHAKSQYTLGVMYINGQGMPRDTVEGYKWMTLAADQGLAEAVLDKRDLGKKLGEAETAAGQSRAVSFKLKSGPISIPVNRKR